MSLRWVETWPQGGVLIAAAGTASYRSSGEQGDRESQRSW